MSPDRVGDDEQVLAALRALAARCDPVPCAVVRAARRALVEGTGSPAQQTRAAGARPTARPHIVPG